jgi:hypothetical protein
VLLNLAQDYRNETYEAHAHELGTFQGHRRALKSTREKRGRASKANPERTQKTPFSLPFAIVLPPKILLGIRVR